MRPEPSQHGAATAASAIPPLTLEEAIEASGVPPALTAAPRGVDCLDGPSLPYGAWLRDYLLPGRPLLLTGALRTRRRLLIIAPPRRAGKPP